MNTSKLYFVLFLIFGLTFETTWAQETSTHNTQEQVLEASDYSKLRALSSIQFERSIESDLDKTQFQTIKSLISKSESYRGNINQDFAFILNLRETLDEKEKSASEVRVNIHLLDDKVNRYVVSQIIAGSGNNNLVLQRANNMWFFKPGTRNALRISPAQRLMGGASYADISNTNYNEHYDPIAAYKVGLGKVTAYKIVLKQKKSGVAYDSINYYIHTASYKPIKADFFTRSGRLVKSMYYRKFKTLKSRELSTEWVIVDGINPKSVTYIEVADLIYKNFDEALFTPEQFKNF